VRYNSIAVPSHSRKTISVPIPISMWMAYTFQFPWVVRLCSGRGLAREPVDCFDTTSEFCRRYITYLTVTLITRMVVSCSSQAWRRQYCVPYIHNPVCTVFDAVSAIDAILTWVGEWWRYWSNDAVVDFKLCADESLNLV